MKGDGDEREFVLVTSASKDGEDSQKHSAQPVHSSKRERERDRPRAIYLIMIYAYAHCFIWVLPAGGRGVSDRVGRPEATIFLLKIYVRITDN